MNSVEGRALTHLESIGLGNASFISMGGPQAHGNSQRGPEGSRATGMASDLPTTHREIAFFALCTRGLQSGQQLIRDLNACTLNPGLIGPFKLEKRRH